VRTAPANSLLLTVNEVGAELRKSGEYVRSRLIKTGKLRAVNEGGVTRVRRSDLEGYVRTLQNAMAPGLKAHGLL
jgi:excisionase family DNA binding protein